MPAGFEEPADPGLDSDVATSSPGAKRRWLLTGGLDYTPAYYRRGYLQDNSGIVVQPYLTGACCLPYGEHFVVQPYLTSWNSFGLRDLDNPMAVMVEGLAGVFVTCNHLWLDVNYAFYNTSPVDGDSAIQEAGLKVTWDAASLWSDGGSSKPFALRTYAALYWETRDEHGSTDAYWELGLEPSWRMDCGNHRVGLAIPVQLGFSARDYYFDNRGAEEDAGYFSVGVSVSLSLPEPPCGGHWYLTGSMQYLRLLAENLVNINQGEADVLVGKVGVGFAF